MVCRRLLGLLDPRCHFTLMFLLFPFFVFFLVVIVVGVACLLVRVGYLRQQLIVPGLICDFISNVACCIGLGVPNLVHYMLKPVTIS